MRQLFRSLLLLLLLTSPVLAQQHLEGVLPEDNGLYSIDVPPGWQAGDPLIIYNHGFTLQQPEQDGFPSTAPTDEARDYWLQQGYALAASTYSTRGWALFDIQRAQRALLAQFREAAADPGEILIVGGSLGGLVSLRTAETFTEDGVDVAGVYALCAPAGGAKSWDSAVDTRLVFDAVCPTPLPAGSSETVPWVVDYEDIPSSIGEVEDLESLQNLLPVVDEIRSCTGLFQPAFLDTDAQLARRAKLKDLLGVTSDEFLKTVLGYSIYPLSDLIQAPEKLAGLNAFDNRFVDYGDADVNAAIRRVERDPLAAVRLRAASDFHGNVGNARVLAIHTSRDELVVPEHLATLDDELPAEQLATAVVVEEQPAHCDFSVAEFAAGFEGLRRWIDDGDKPEVAELDLLCESLAAELGGDPRCAFEPTLVPSELDTRILPRNLDIQLVSRFHTGAWYDPDTDGEGLIIEVLDGGERAVVAWYTYPPAGNAGKQAWIIGVGRVTEDGIHVAEARQYDGARFGDAFDPADVEGDVWGELTLWFDGCGSGALQSPDAQGVGRLRFDGPPDYGSGERRLFQLSHNAGFPQHCVSATPPLPVSEQVRYTGSWYRGPDAPGEGLQLQVDSSNRILAIWYTFSPDGEAAWLIGSAPLPADGEPWVIPMQRPRGAEFGDAFDPAEVDRLPWGEIRIDFSDCDRAELAWTASEAGWSSGATSIERLTRPAGVPECGGG